MTVKNFNDKHLLWWVMKWFQVVQPDGIALKDFTKDEFDVLVDLTNKSKKEKDQYKKWIWNAFKEKISYVE